MSFNKAKITQLETVLKGLNVALSLGVQEQAEVLAEIDATEEEKRLEWKKYIPDHLDKVLQDPKGKILIAFSGGKDSIAMVLDLLDKGVPKEKIELWHHEVDGRAGYMYDWPCTTSYCQAFADAFGLPLLFSYREGGIKREMYRTNEGLQDIYFQEKAGGPFLVAKSKPGNSTKMIFPAVSGDLRYRWCSDTAKISVMQRAITNSSRFKEGNFLVLTGERRQESKKRKDYEVFEAYRAKSKKRKIYTWRSVIDWTEEEIWQIIERYRVQPHPCYELGYSRCSCFTCIFLSPNLWATTEKLSPSTVDQFAQSEKDFNFTLYDKKTIREHIAKGTPIATDIAIQRWKAEALSTFTSSILVDQWTLPAGAFKSESGGAR